MVANTSVCATRPGRGPATHHPSIWKPHAPCGRPRRSSPRWATPCSRSPRAGRPALPEHASAFRTSCPWRPMRQRRPTVRRPSERPGPGMDMQRAGQRLGRTCTATTSCRSAVTTDEGVSGTTHAVDRAGLACALGAVPADADGVIVAHLDRLVRSLTVQEVILAAIWRAAGRCSRSTRARYCATPGRPVPHRHAPDGRRIRVARSR